MTNTSALPSQSTQSAGEPNSPGHLTDDRPGLEARPKALRKGDTLVAWKLDQLGRDLRPPVNFVHDLSDRGGGLKVLAGQGANLDATTANGRLVSGTCAEPAGFGRKLSSGQPFKMTAAILRPAKAAMGQAGTKAGALRADLGVSRQTLHRHVDPTGAPRPDGAKLSGRKGLVAHLSAGHA